MKKNVETGPARSAREDSRPLLHLPRGVDLIAANRRLFLTLVTAIAGGALTALLDLPMDWMLGALLLILMLSLGGVRLQRPDRLRSLMFVVIGVVIGGSLTMETVELASEWLPSLAIVLFSVVSTACLTVTLCRHLGKLDPPTRS